MFTNIDFYWNFSHLNRIIIHNLSKFFHISRSKITFICIFIYPCLIIFFKFLKKFLNFIN